MRAADFSRASESQETVARGLRSTLGLFKTYGQHEIENAPGIEIISKPNLSRYPGYGGVGEIRVLVSKFYDADGYILEVNQVLRD